MADFFNGSAAIRVIHGASIVKMKLPPLRLATFVARAAGGFDVLIPTLAGGAASLHCPLSYARAAAAELREAGISPPTNPGMEVLTLPAPTPVVDLDAELLALDKETQRAFFTRHFERVFS